MNILLILMMPPAKNNDWSGEETKCVFFFCKVAGTWMSQKAILDQLLLGNKKRKEFEK
jgi:hypothetical protein